MMVVYGIEIDDMNRERFVKIAEDALASISLPGTFLVDLVPISKDLNSLAIIAFHIFRSSAIYPSVVSWRWIQENR